MYTFSQGAKVKTLGRQNERNCTIGGTECCTFLIFLFSYPYLAWNIWFEAPSLLPAKWQCQNSPSEGNFIKKCLSFECFIIPSWEEKTKDVSMLRISSKNPHVCFVWIFTKVKKHFSTKFASYDSV